MDRTAGFYPVNVGSNPTGGTRDAESRHDSVAAFAFLATSRIRKTEPVYKTTERSACR